MGRFLRSKILGCQHKANSAACPDSDACTTGETCNNFNCVKKAVVCYDGNPCTKDGCDAVKGCQVSNLPDNTPCEDGGLCASGKCSGK